jgi:exosortase B
MSAVLERAAAREPTVRGWVMWLPVAAGLAVLYLPTFYRLAGWIWQLDEQAHGPLILAVSAFLIWQRRSVLVASTASTMPVTGGLLLGLGLLCYAIGRSQEIALVETGSLIPVLAGTLLILVGWAAVRQLWFPLMFLVFMVPLPGFLVDALTGPLKQQVSAIAEHLLYWTGYPIARSGVILSIGPYQLLVADACSGLHSMYSLSALGLLYLYMMRHASVLRNGLMVASILPIAFCANVARVLLLVLVTYHFGDEAGQGFIHDSAGMILFMIALVLLFSLDSLLGMMFSRRARAERT